MRLPNFVPCILAIAMLANFAIAKEPWLSIKGNQEGDLPGKGKHTWS